MPNGDATATANPGTGSTGTASRGTTGSRTAASAPAPILLYVPRTSQGDEVFHRLLNALGMQSPNLAGPNGFALLNDFRVELSRIMSNFRARSSKSVVTLYFTPREHSSRKDLRNIPNHLFTLRIQHELQVEEERRASEIRREDERRERTEQERATAARLAQQAARDRDRQAAEQKIQTKIREIAIKTQFWQKGFVTGAYIKGEFIIHYYPKEIAPPPQPTLMAENVKKLERGLWDAYWGSGAFRIIYEIPISEPVARSRAASPLAEKSPTVQGPASMAKESCADLLAKGDPAGIECKKREGKQYADDWREQVEQSMKPLEAIAEQFDLSKLENWVLAVGVLKVGKVVGGSVVVTKKVFLESSRKLQKYLLERFEKSAVYGKELKRATYEQSLHRSDPVEYSKLLVNTLDDYVSRAGWDAVESEMQVHRDVLQVYRENIVQYFK